MEKLPEKSVAQDSCSREQAGSGGGREDFLWGAAISAYQCEGGNFNCDWHFWEKEKNLAAAGLACDHYHLFKKDFQFAAELGLNSLRLSTEWSRIMPSFDVVSDREIDHYGQVVDSLLAFNLKPIVTLHHFTNPAWFAQRGGWLNAGNVDYFLKYLRITVEALRDKVDTWVIFNEPAVYVYNGFIYGKWPPGLISLKSARKALDNITGVYRDGYNEIKNIYKRIGKPVSVSLTQHFRYFCPCPDFSFGTNRLAAALVNKIFNFSTLDYLAKKKALDFIGVNYYCKSYIRRKGMVGEECLHPYHRERKNSLGWYIYPEGFYKILMALKKYNLPLIVMENGTAENNETAYFEYLRSHLEQVKRAKAAGLDIRGYLWWSLLDNFEWDNGYDPRFGLIEVDYKTQERKIRPFAREYAKICANPKNALARGK